MEQDAAQRIHHDEVMRGRERMMLLTPREREVCHLVARGLLNKQIADTLGASPRTIKLHRSRVMHKLGATSVADVVKLLALAEE